MKKKSDFWAVKAPEGDILTSTICRHRRDAQYLFCDDADEAETSWPRYRKQGYRCVKVRIEEVGR